MRTHRLRDLALPGSITVLEKIPDFDFYRLQRVGSLTVERADDDSQGTTIEVEATYSGDGLCFEVGIAFLGVRRAKIPELMPWLFFSELEIEDVAKDQMEGIRYRVKDYGTEFEVLCSEVNVRLVSG